MRSSLWMLVGSLCVGFVVAGCSESAGQGQAPLGKSMSTEPLASTIIASRLTTLEDAIFNADPLGGYAIATSRGHHLLISMSTGAFLYGNGPRAYVLRDDRLVNPNGTELPGTALTANQGSPAVSSGTHWLAAIGSVLSVLDLEGNLVSSRALPINGRTLVWGKDRALLLGFPTDGSSDAGIQKGQFLDDSGEPLGPVFDIAPGATLLYGGAAFDGSHFVVEYSTPAGVFAVAVSSSGTVGTPVQIATDPGNVVSYGLALGAVSDGQNLLLLYQTSGDDPAGSPTGPHYRMASVDASLAITLSDQQIAAGLKANVTRAAYTDGHYRLYDYYNYQALSLAHDGTPQGSVFTWNPFSFEGAVGYRISAGEDGSSPIVVDTQGHASRLDGNLGVIDTPPIAFGIGPETMGMSGAVFDGTNFRVEWQDPGRSSVRSIGVAESGGVLAPGAQALGGPNSTVSGQTMASNGSSILRLGHDSAAATLTRADGTVVPVDLSALAFGPGTTQLVATNGTDYLAATRSDTTALATVSADGVVTHTAAITAGANAIAFDGTQWLAASNAYGQVSVTPLSADLTAGPTKSLLTVPGDYGTWVTIASNGSSSFVAWVAHVADQYQVYGSRVSQDLTLLDAPGILLGTSFSWNPPTATSDGTNFWVAWPDAGTSRPAVRRIAPEPINGTVLLDANPFVPADPPMGWATLAAQPGGPVLLVENAYGGGPMIERVLSVGDPSSTNTVGAGL